MKSLEVTDEQYAYIQHLREVIADEVVGKYGFVRERDAVQFLIDNLDGDLEFDGEVDATPAAAAAEAAAAESDDDNAITYDEDEDVPDDLEEGDEGEGSTDAEAGDAEGNGDAAAPSPAVDADEADDDADDGEAGDDDGAASDDDGAASDDDMLDRMMNLLETHDDKWEESPAADYRYRVTLPDGTTEDVQTKDDVRALLFKNYR